ALACGATVAVALGCAVGLWDRASRAAGLWLYGTGVLAVLLVAAESDKYPVWNAPLAPLAPAGFVLGVSGLTLALSRRTTPLLGMPERGDSWSWLPSAQSIV